MVALRGVAIKASRPVLTGVFGGCDMVVVYCRAKVVDDVQKYDAVEKYRYERGPGGRKTWLLYRKSVIRCRGR